MKKFAIEILFLVALGLIIQCLNTSWSAVWISGAQWLDGETNLVTLLYMIACTIGFASFGVVLCVQAQKHLTKHYGGPALQKTLDQYTESLKAAQKELDEAVQATWAKNRALETTLQVVEKHNKDLIIANDEMAEKAATRMTDIEMLTARIKELEAQLPSTGATPQQ